MSFLTQPISIIPLKPRRQIDTINVDVIINESTSDVLTITKQPVQQGASITDHAYKEPTTLSMSILMASNSVANFSAQNPLLNIGQTPSQFLATIYKQFIDLQSSRVPFNVITPKRIYGSMLISAIGQTTDKNTENILAINLSFQEVIIVKVSTTTVSRVKQKSPGATGKTEKAGRKSALVSLKERIGAVFR